MHINTKLNELNAYNQTMQTEKEELMDMKLYAETELSELAYKEFLKEVEVYVLDFEHIVNKETGTIIFNEKNVVEVTEFMNGLTEMALDFTPYFGGTDMGREYNFTDQLWEAIWECFGK